MLLVAIGLNGSDLYQCVMKKKVDVKSDVVTHFSENGSFKIGIKVKDGYIVAYLPQDGDGYLSMKATDYKTAEKDGYTIHFFKSKNGILYGLIDDLKEGLLIATEKEVYYGKDCTR